jgi:5'-methylthioadenosine phosphorylase
MSRLALLGGHGILGSGWMSDAPRVDIDTEHGPVAVRDSGNVVVLQRHGVDHFTSASAIDHRAHLRAVEASGCEKILALASVGSLRPDLGVGTMVAPDDFIALHLGLTFFTDYRGHQVPGFDRAWRVEIIESWRRVTEEQLVDGGVYWQAIGPRFETPAEIRLMARHADLVGMTVASECVLAGELGIPYAAICVVDNLANGLEDAALSIASFESGAANNRARLIGVLGGLVADLTR